MCKRWTLVLLIGVAFAACFAAPFRAAADEMGRKPLVVAALMYRPVKWDKDANRQALDAAIRKAHAAGAELVVTPEGALEGYLENEVRLTTGAKRPEMIARFNRIAEPVAGPYVEHFRKLCRELRIYLVLGLLEADAGKTYNSAVVLGPDGKLLGTYRKTHFAQGYKTGDEKGDNPAGYLRGTDYPVFDVAGRKLGVMICFDRRVPKVARNLVKSGAQFIVNPSYGMSGDCNRRFIASRAKENDVPILFVHPEQTVFAASDGSLSIDVRPKKGDERMCMVTID